MKFLTCEQLMIDLKAENQISFYNFVQNKVNAAIAAEKYETVSISKVGLNQRREENPLPRFPLFRFFNGLNYYYTTDTRKISQLNSEARLATLYKNYLSKYIECRRTASNPRRRISKFIKSSLSSSCSPSIVRMYLSRIRIYSKYSRSSTIAYKYQGVAGYVHKSDILQKSIPLYQFSNGKNFILGIDKSKIPSGYRDEGLIGQIFNYNQVEYDDLFSKGEIQKYHPNLVPFYDFFNKETSIHFYTANKLEGEQKSGFELIGRIGYIYTSQFRPNDELKQFYIDEYEVNGNLDNSHITNTLELDDEIVFEY